eukprot:9470330-Pyramimonas_sp.AAC.2
MRCGLRKPWVAPWAALRLCTVIRGNACHGVRDGKRTARRCEVTVARARAAESNAAMRAPLGPRDPKGPGERYGAMRKISAHEIAGASGMEKATGAARAERR